MNLAMFMAQNLQAQKKRRMCKTSWELYFSWDIRDIFEPESICLDVQSSVVISSCDLVLKEFILKKLELWLSFDIITNHVQKTCERVSDFVMANVSIPAFCTMKGLSDDEFFNSMTCTSGFR